MPERRRVRVDAYRGPGRAERAVASPVSETGEETCSCPELDRDEWDRVESDWSDITFVRGTTGALLGVVTGMSKVRAELEARAAKIKAVVPADAMLLLGAGQFRRPALLEVEGVDRAGKGIERPGGIAYTRLVEAPPGKVRAVVSEVRDDARRRYGRFPDAIWLWYVTCRVCSQARNFETLVVAHYKDVP